MKSLTVKDVAELKVCSERYIQKMVKEGKVQAERRACSKNGVEQYFFVVEQLPPDLQKKYYAKQGTATELTTAEPKENQPFETFSGEERQQISFWIELLREWLDTRNQYRRKTEADPLFVAKCQLENPDLEISARILYRKLSAWRNGDFAALLGERGGWNRGLRETSAEAIECFQALYLSDAQLPASECYRLTQEWIRENHPDKLEEMTSERTFRRHVERLPVAVVEYFRHGKKAFLDKCAPYIERLYDDLQANDVWVADNHTFDVMTRTDDGEKIHRLYITAFLDAKTGVMVGWNITEAPCSHSTVLALRHAILRFGVPKCIYVDNGSEFLTHDIGGRGHRKRKSGVDMPPTILEQMDIRMVNALVTNARAKPIERTFLTLKNTISRTFPTFTGGNIIERPESLKWQLKHGHIPFDQQLRDHVEALIDGDYNVAQYGGSESKYKNMSRIEAWNSSIQEAGQRVCSKEDLALLLLRTSTYQKVKRNGVFITISGEKLWYNCEDNWKYLDKEVYVRYDPAELRSVRVYDKEDRFLAEWGLDTAMLVNYITEAQEEIASQEARLRRSMKAVKKLGEEITGGKRIDAMALAAARAARGLADFNPTAPQNQTQVHYKSLLKASGSDIDVEILDIDRQNQNALKRKNSRE